MRVAVYHSNNDVRIDERARPKTGPGELLVRVEASGIDVTALVPMVRCPVLVLHRRDMRVIPTLMGEAR